VGQTCALHDEITTGLRDDMKKALRKLDEIQESQAVRRERCASNEGALKAASDALKEVKQEAADQWKAINDLKKLVYIGVGVALTSSALAPIVTGVVVYHLTK